MPPRSRPRRSTVKDEPAEVSTPGRRSTRGARTEPEPKVELLDEDADDDAEGEPDDETIEEPVQPVAGPSKRGRGRPRKDRTATQEVFERDTEVEKEDVTGTPRRRNRKSVSYREIPPEEEAADDDEEDEEIEVQEEAESEVHGTEDGESPDKPRRETKHVFEKVGSGRGGFSVKGAAAAAARARWAKVRQQKLEAGDASEEDRPKRRPAASAARNQRRRNDDELPEPGQPYTVKGETYKMGEDELDLPGNEKGDAKIDVNGKLLGEREFRFFTFASDSRKNTEKQYALTIDVARSMGYNDSLAFLRRFPTILKLSCQPAERDFLIENGRVTGNLKHRMVTIVAVKNVYKLLGARTIKEGKWVEDDYDEEEALVRCQEGGFTPGTVLQEDEPVRALAGKDSGAQSGDAATRAANLVPFYSVGGPTTHFAGNGADPVMDAGHGNKRAKLRTMGVTEEDWMLRTAEETRRVDINMREFRQDQLVPLAGEDAKVWVHALENATEGKEDPAEAETVVETKTLSTLAPPTREMTAATPLPGAEDVEMGGEVVLPRSEGTIVVETEAERLKNAAQWRWGLGTWQQGAPRAVYEPHTHTPHVPQFTQPCAADRHRISHSPLLASYSDSSHKNFVQSHITGNAARGLASVEYVFEPAKVDAAVQEAVDDAWDMMWQQPTAEKRLQDVADAEEWEREARKRQRLQLAV